MAYKAAAQTKKTGNPVQQQAHAKAALKVSTVKSAGGVEGARAAAPSRAVPLEGRDAGAAVGPAGAVVPGRPRAVVPARSTTASFLAPRS